VKQTSWRLELEAYIAAEQLLAEGDTIGNMCIRKKESQMSTITHISHNEKDDLVYELIQYCTSDEINQICLMKRGKQSCIIILTDSLEMTRMLKTIVIRPKNSMKKGL
jgi:hypothetical protein